MGEDGQLLLFHYWAPLILFEARRENKGCLRGGYHLPLAIPKKSGKQVRGV